MHPYYISPAFSDMRSRPGYRRRQPGGGGRAWLPRRGFWEQAPERRARERGGAGAEGPGPRAPAPRPPNPRSPRHFNMIEGFSFSAVVGFSLVLCLGHIDWTMETWRREGHFW